MLFVWEPHEAHGRLGRAAAPPGPRDGVAHAAIGQPAGVAAVIPQQLPGGEDLAHFGDLSTVVETGLHCLVVGQLGGVDQVVKAAVEVGCETEHIISAFVFIPEPVVPDAGHRVLAPAGLPGLGDGVLH